MDGNRDSQGKSIQVDAIFFSVQRMPAVYVQSF